MQGYTSGIGALGGTGAASTGTAGATAGSSGASLLSPTDFLQLLVTEMANQDPLSPVDSGQFVQQMAVLDEVTALQQLSSQVTALSQYQATGEAVALLGRTVTLQPPGGAAPVTGTVTSIQASTTGPTVTVGGTAYPLSQVVAVSGGTAP